jgi:hypothetical protein
MKVQVFSDEGKPVESSGEPGELVCSAPFPSQPAYFWGDKDSSRYQSAYFEKFPGMSLARARELRRGHLRANECQVFGIKEIMFAWIPRPKVSSSWDAVMVF